MTTKLDGRPGPNHIATATTVELDLGKQSLPGRVTGPDRLGHDEVSRSRFAIINPASDQFQEITASTTLPNSTNGEGLGMVGDLILGGTGIASSQGPGFATVQSQPTGIEESTAADNEIPVARLIGPGGVSVVYLN